MTPQGRRCVLDTTAVLEWSQRKGKWQTIDRCLPHAVIPALVLAETIYISASQTRHRIPPKRLQQTLKERGAHIESVTEHDGLRAGDLISRSREKKTLGALSLGDGLCIAVAERLNLPLITNDHYWESLDLRVQVHSYK